MRKTAIVFFTFVFIRPSVHLSVCSYVRPSAWNNLAPTGRIFMEFDIWTFFENFLRTFQESLSSDINNGYFRRRPINIFDHITAQIFLEWEMFQTDVVQKIKTRRLCWITFKKKKTRRLRQCCKIFYSWKDPRWQNGVWALHAVYLRLQTHTEYKIIVAFPQQHWLHELAPVLRYTYTVCLVFWVKTPSSRRNGLQRFGGAYCCYIWHILQTLTLHDLIPLKHYVFVIANHYIILNYIKGFRSHCSKNE